MPYASHWLEKGTPVKDTLVSGKRTPVRGSIWRNLCHTITPYQTGGCWERIGMRTFRSLKFACGFDFARDTVHWAIVLPKAQHMSNGRQHLSDVLKRTKLAVTHAQYILYIDKYCLTESEPSSHVWQHTHIICYAYYVTCSLARQQKQQLGQELEASKTDYLLGSPVCYFPHSVRRTADLHRSEVHDIFVPALTKW
jgi:hypothetical protein